MTFPLRSPLRPAEPADEEELAGVKVEAKKRAEQMRQPSDLWNLESYLTERRKQIDRKFDYRYSVLVFGNLIHEGGLSEQ